jgi:Holliday junction resolvase-like predicted endonuclease
VTNYAAGRRAEWKARDLLKAYGCDVTRSAGSKGLIDLVALCKHDIVLAQVKRTKNGGWVDANWRELEKRARANRYPYARVVAIVFTYGVKEPQFYWVGGPT